MATKEQTKKVAAKTAAEVKKGLEKVVPKLEKVVAAAKKPEHKKAASAVLETTIWSVAKKIAASAPAKKSPVKGSNARANKMAKDAKADSKISEALKNVSARAMSEIKSINH